MKRWSNQSPDPTPEEIRQRCAEIQAEWSDHERWKRMRVDLRPVRWEVPEPADLPPVG